MSRYFDAREEYGFKEYNVFDQFSPINQQEILDWLNEQAEKRGVFNLGPDDALEAKIITDDIWDNHLDEGPEWVYSPGNWYAVMEDDDDDDWGTGSYDLDEAKEMVKKYPNGYIAIIDEHIDENGPHNPTCVGEIRGDDLYN